MPYYNVAGLNFLAAPYFDSQALAGAIVAEALLTVCGGQVTICPWSTRDGLLLNLLDGLATVGPRRTGSGKAA